MNKELIDFNMGCFEKAPTLNVPEDNPFLNDKFERESDVKVLTKIVESCQKGAVFALKGTWGSGKTSFVKMWRQYLLNEGFQVVYYNAWEDDICDEPMFSMIKRLRFASEDSSYDTFVEKAGRVIVGGLFGALKGASGFWGEVVKGTVKGTLNQLEKDCVNSLKSKNDTTTLICEFKEALIEHVAFTCKEKTPIVYFVDELDRCNPTFAVKTLERIKHLFDIPNIVFVLSIDKEQLCHSICGYFGSEAFNSEEYLRRFIDIEYELSQIIPEKFCASLFEHFQINEKMNKEAASHLLDFAKKCCVYYQLKCRQIEKILLLFTIASFHVDQKPLDDYISKSYSFELMFYLSTIKVCEPVLYLKICERQITKQELTVEIERSLFGENYKKNKIDILKDSIFLEIITLLIYSYKECGNYNTGSEINSTIVFSVLPANTMYMGFSRCREKGISCDLGLYVNKLNLINDYDRNFIDEADYKEWFV